jgi:hypothetical protein
MIPILMRLHVRQRESRGFRFWFPVIIVWIILFAVMAALFPLMLLAALLTWHRGPGKWLLLIYPMLFSILWRLSGLHVHVESRENGLLIDFI